MKKSILIVLIVAAALVFAACGNAGVIEIENMNGDVIEISTKDTTDEQIEALQSVASGESNVMELMRSGAFTPEELEELGLGGGMGNMPQGGVNRETDFSNVDIDELDLSGLSDEQISAVEDIIAGEITPQEAADDGVLTMEELTQIGLMGNMPQGGGQRQKPVN